MAELCHIYLKDQLRRHIVFTDWVSQADLCPADDTAEIQDGANQSVYLPAGAKLDSPGDSR